MANYIDNGNKLDWALPFQRTGDFPIDRSSMFSSYADAVKYAKGDSTDPDSRGLQGSSYVGQIITVYENDTVNVYKIEADRSLTLVGEGSGGTSDYEDLENQPSINNVTLLGNKTSADLGLASQSSVTDINSKIPNQASANNQLADKDFVNSSVSTATATFRGTFTSLNTLQATEGDKNDYAFYSHTDSAGNTVYDRYKYVGIPESDLPEGYIEVDSINCLGDNGYINTEIMPSSTLVIETALNSPNFNEYAYMYFMGSGDYSVWNDQFGRAMVIKRGGTTQLDQLTTKSFEINSKNTLKIAPNGIYVNGTNIGSIAFADTAINPIYLFTKINNNGTFATSLNSTTKKIYRTKFINNNEVIADMVPCYREIDYKAGFYDVVRNKFYVNDKNENNFTYTTLSTDKWEYEYSLNNSSFTAEQWSAINSGVTSNIVSSVSNIESLIPSNATVVNQLADKDFVNSSISTATADFKGTFTNLATLQATDGNRNDYAFYSHTDSSGNTVYDRYKYVGLPETRVPVEYTEVYSIGRSTTQGAYINTGIVLKSNYTIETKMSFGAVSGYTNRYYFGAADSSNYFYLQKPERSILRITSSTGNSSSASIEDGTEYLIEVKNNKYYVDGSVYGNAVVPNIGDDYPLYLFGYNNQGSGTSNGNITVNFHSFKVWDDEGELILDLVPCLNYENQAGMYDVVSGAFLTGGSYSTVPLSTDRWEYEYTLNNSSFTAAQWATINSGLTSQVATDINTINGLIPSQAGVNNQLADKGYVESSISTATASFKGTFTSLTTLQATEGDRNDYAFYSHQDSSGNTIYDRYKYVGPKEVILPAGYTQVGRISGNYINLNIAPRNDWHFILKVSSPYFANWPPAVPVFGVQSGDKRYDMYKPSYENPLFLKTTVGQWGIQVSNNDIHTIEVKSNRAMYIDGSLIATLGSTTNLPTIPVYLLGINSNGSAWKENNVHCYGLTIYDNEENLLMDLVPCIRDQDGSIGVYDLAGTINPDTNSPFYSGATSSSPLSEDKWEYEYSLSNLNLTPAQWATINSGLVANVTSTGYDATKTQILKNINGTLTWVDES